MGFDLGYEDSGALVVYCLVRFSNEVDVLHYYGYMLALFSESSTIPSEIREREYTLRAVSEDMKRHASDLAAVFDPTDDGGEFRCVIC